MMKPPRSANAPSAPHDDRFTGDQQQITDMFAALDNFEFWFNIVTP